MLTKTLLMDRVKMTGSSGIRGRNNRKGYMWLIVGLTCVLIADGVSLLASAHGHSWSSWPMLLRLIAAIVLFLCIDALIVLYIKSPSLPNGNS